MAVITVSGDRLIAFRRSHHDSGDDRLLTNVEMAKPADETHAIHLPGFFLKPADKEHGAEGGELRSLVKSSAVRVRVVRVQGHGFTRGFGCHLKPIRKTGDERILK